MARVTPLPDYLRGGDYVPAQIAGDQGAFRPTPAQPASRISPVAAALAAALVLAFVLKQRRR